MTAILEKPDCEYCEKVAARHGREPPCETCIPEPHRNNAEAIGVYSIVMSQLIITPDGKPFDIDINAVDVAMKHMNIENKPQCFEKVVILARHFIDEWS